MKAGCLEESTVLAFLGGTLSPEGRSDVEEHIATCDECAELIAWAAADQGDASGAPGPEGRPFVLIGHSQGSWMLQMLIARTIENDPAVAQRLKLAIIPGFNVLVPQGKLVGRP